ncbi:hypothetical protein [Comamonas sp.]|uniref:hypothetical protein n=1 Tax=Comamonas sp. TaxID=34028 RepID=UPI00289B3DD7|nr:hypothetical protein [Comamonas sp.]
MSLYDTIESAFLQVLKSGRTPSRLHLTEAGLQTLINDPTLGASWTPSIPDFWEQRVLGMPLQKSLAHNAIEVDGELVLLDMQPPSPSAK